MTVPDQEAHWGIAYYTNSDGPRARKWYYLARLVKVDGKWWELSQVTIPTPQAHSLQRSRAVIQGWDCVVMGRVVLDGIFTRAPAPRLGSQMVWSLEGKS